MIGLIPARGGSKGIPRKNIKPLGGKPLIQWTIESARASGVVDRLVVSTEDEEIATVAHDLGEEVLERPRALALDQTPMRDVVVHAITTLDLSDSDTVVLLQPTTPLRKPEWIRAVVGALKYQPHPDCAMTVIPIPVRYRPEVAWRFVSDVQIRPVGEIRNTRQEVPVSYVGDGAVYAFGVRAFLESGSIYGHFSFGLVVPETPNLDEPEDWEEAERRVASMLVTA